MKKILILAPFILTACNQTFHDHNSKDIVYTQAGNNCIYSETDFSHFVDVRGFDNNHTPKTVVNFEKSITYPNTKCDKVIDSDLKNAINKTLINKNL